MKIVKQFQLDIAIFTAVKNRCILHGRVFVMGVSFGDGCLRLTRGIMGFSGQCFRKLKLVFINMIVTLFEPRCEITGFSHICENKDADQLRGNCGADQRLCFRCTEVAFPLLS